MEKDIYEEPQNKLEFLDKADPERTLKDKTGVDLTIKQVGYLKKKTEEFLSKPIP